MHMYIHPMRAFRPCCVNVSPLAEVGSQLGFWVEEELKLLICFYSEHRLAEDAHQMERFPSLDFFLLLFSLAVLLRLGVRTGEVGQLFSITQFV